MILNERRRRLGWFLVGSLATGMFMVIVGAILYAATTSHQVRQTQQAHAPLVDNNAKILARVEGCTTPGRPCYQRGQRQIAAAVADVERRRATMTTLRDDLVARVVAEVPDAQLNGVPLDRPGERLPGNAHLSFPGCEGDSLLMLLDARGIECSTGSACTAGVARPSHVLLAMG